MTKLSKVFYKIWHILLIVLIALVIIKIAIWIFKIKIAIWLFFLSVKFFLKLGLFVLAVVAVILYICFKK